MDRYRATRNYYLMLLIYFALDNNVGAIQIIYAASTSLGKQNFKKGIAHIGFIVIGIGSITNTGLNGAILQMLSHRLIGAALFFLGRNGF